ncbi:MAG: hypothetical protein JRI84_13555 [Deltaproteobacteria bacterium]|nr:hypothetical protein [Deltaproteobacteria bacterium]
MPKTKQHAFIATTLVIMAVVHGNLSPLQAQPEWKISALPSSVRLNPSSGKILEDRPDIYEMQPLGNLLEKTGSMTADKSA